MRVGLVGAFMTVALSTVGGAPAPLVVHSDESTLTSVRTRSLQSGSVGSISGTAALTSDARRSVAVQSPDSATVAIVSVDAAGALSLHRVTDSGVGARVSVASGVASADAFDAAYQSPSGRLVFAYATAGSATCWVRTYGTDVSIAEATPLALSSTPVRVAVVPRAGSNEVLIVAQDSSLKLAATVWNGTSFRATETLDSAFDGGPARWDGVWTRAGTAMVVWARAGESATQMRALSGDTWETVVASPMASAAMDSVTLASDPARGSGGAAALLVTSKGTAEVSVYDASAWSGVTELTAVLDVARERPADLAYEGSGGAVVCAWVESDSDRVRVRRRSAAGSWGSAANSGEVGDDIEEVIVGSIDADTAVGVLARREEVTAGGAGVLGNYVVYSSGGTIQQGDRNSYTGLVGSDVDGVTVPEEPEGTAGSTNVSVSHDQTRTIAPGNYRDLSFGDRATMNFSAGTTVFRKLSGSGNDSRFVCDTSAGDVTIVFLQSQVQFKDRFRIERSGTGAVFVHINGGAFKVGNDCVFEAALYAHGGSTNMGDRTRLTGHLFGHSTIKIGHDGVFATPTTWSIGGGTSVTLQHLHAMVVTSGSIGSVSDLTGAGIETEEDVALAISVPPTPGNVRVVRWSETAP